MLEQINDLDNVRLFAAQLIKEGISFHPDDDFYTYVNLETGLQTYTESEAAKRNKLLAQCFKVCRENQTDIYDLMNEITLVKSGLSKFIPLPSEGYRA